MLPYKRVVIKTGSSLLFSEDGQLRREWMASLAAEIAAIRRAGTEVILVSSGAVALGRGLLAEDAASLKQPNRKQAAAALGQPLLMQHWQEAFAPYSLPVGQLLLSVNDTERRAAYLSARNTLRVLMQHGTIPVINENDSVTLHGVLYGDNDRLAARIAAMVDADGLILLSDIDGLYDGNPRLNQQANHLPEVPEITDAIRQMAGSTGSVYGSGGMATKIDAAEIAHRAGCETLILSGLEISPISHSLSKARYTRFHAAITPLKARDSWISGSIKPVGSVQIDAGAVQALGQGSSLLHVGVMHLQGDFYEGDVLQILSATGQLLGKGLASIDAITARQIMGKRSHEIAQILGYEAPTELIHRDYLVWQG